MQGILRLLAAKAGTVCVLMVAGCATGYNLQPGMNRDQVIASMGRPTAVVPLPNGGERLQYSQQPAGQYAYMVDMDSSGRMVSFRQVLNQNEFSRLNANIGQWTRADVEREFGRPARIERLANWNGDIMTYRWNEGPKMDRFYWVYLDSQNIVRRAHPGIETLRGGAMRD
ncbi:MULTISPECIES: outer membrane protein assembly factor BamE [Ramlibacter]|nr:MULTISPECIES: outer membrane protein assembly factor BamE [Ramlibacter]